jgi:hypothetical protein
MKEGRGDLLLVFGVNRSGVGDDMVKHEPSVTSLSSFMNTGLSFNSGSCGSLQTGGGE